jgi:predicted nucleic acid-binding Zn ribbon protein
VSSVRQAPRPLALAIEGLTATLAPPGALARIQACWTAAVGETIAAVANPAAERDGVLTVRCESAVWSQELGLMANELLGRLNATLGEELVHKLRCRSG